MTNDTMHPTRLANPSAKRPTVKNSDVDALIKAAWEQGWWCERSKKNHVRCFPPDKAKSAVLLESTPSDYRSVPNSRSRMRKSGLTI